MSIEVRIPKEITEYKEKIIFGLSIRQLICFTVAITLGVGTYIFVTKWSNADVASYVVIVEVMPIFAIGFIKKNGFTFEKYAAMMFQHKCGRNRRWYATHLLIDEISTETGHSLPDKKRRGEKYVWNVYKKKHSTDKNLRECTSFEVTAKSRKRKSQEALREINSARKEYRTEKQAAEKTAKKCCSTPDSTTYHQI
ncbi:MAG TPA: hypothetical protein DD730_13510 [Desulfosporosinus sp.]|nr:hypothetical protein [Desulfosporosinus sp.]